ncbi:MAG: hypothetical protein UR28_C0019G0009 [Candidatus Peregrinibacteria bacterium GW2011_GWF2_33_10]|nr:MAG: hypothetical protein UR28_C0019G0009 [Candidatus Peregrinibacteria bacterium GW2011_GWF2_33_10]OGJ43972.1 MAG: hypothetical protein A2272_05060 [Candidatus Peregrinibacteria bacterium RIFOXYA12_FULL_33_12]OGJ45301.1 MAG: hypothetical protein A2263_03435 [Candidatus Peregrinibacteria bacterium RIFOXYA2_FULL_33_21]OGJ49995.1 MAG: hypothetical protein A2307_04475 [Candidatus Peregrinibacteria bacterium RIFOXYB2_FULL_33_20]
MFWQKKLPILLVILFFYAVFLAGRLGYIYELYQSKPEIKEVADINLKVCRLSILQFNNQMIRGQINFNNARFSYKDKVFLTDENGNFEIVK